MRSRLGEFKLSRNCATGPEPEADVPFAIGCFGTTFKLPKNGFPANRGSRLAGRISIRKRVNISVLSRRVSDGQGVHPTLSVAAAFGLSNLVLQVELQTDVLDDRQLCFEPVHVLF